MEQDIAAGWTWPALLASLSRASSQQRPSQLSGQLGETLYSCPHRLQHTCQALLAASLVLLPAPGDPRSGHCQALVPEYAKAAALLRNDSSGPRLATVNAAEEQALSREFGVRRDPVLKLFRDGNRTHPIDFIGEQDCGTAWGLLPLGNWEGAVPASQVSRGPALPCPACCHEGNSQEVQGV